MICTFIPFWFGDKEFLFLRQASSRIVQFSSVAQSCPTPCDPINHSTPGLPVHHQLREFTQIHVHWVSDAIEPSYPLLSPSPPALNLSQHQSLFKWISSLHQVAKILEFSASTSVPPMNTQDWSPLGWTGWISKGLSRVVPNTTVQKHQFFGFSFLYSPTHTSIYDHWRNHSLDQTDLCWQSNVSAL